MATHPSLVMHRRTRRGLTAAVAVLLTANAAAFWSVGLRTSAVTVDDAVRRFRESSAASPIAAAATTSSSATAAAAPRGGSTDPGVGATDAPLLASVAQQRGGGAAGGRGGSGALAASDRPSTPAPGVYVYATEGFEQVDILGGARHDYPAETTMTITPTSCGVDVRWDLLEERWDRWHTCASGKGIALQRLDSYHEFFGQVDERTYDCDPATMLRPDTDQAGATFRGRCSASSATATIAGTVIGTETVTIGGTPVPALRVRLDEELSGETRGTRISDSWFALSDGLLLKRTMVTDADTKATFGDTQYREEATVTLTSLSPRR